MDDGLAAAVGTGSVDAVVDELLRLGWRPPPKAIPADLLRERFLAKVKVDAGDCWVWQGKPNDGYGSFRRRAAHRVAWELFVGPIPKGLVVDHCVCFRRICVNPAHLQLVTPLENTRLAIERGQKHPGQSVHHGAKRWCKRGHPLNAQNTYVDPAGKRFCKTCRAMHQAKYRAAARAAR